MEKIIQKLLELGFNTNTKGFLYWIEAIKYSKDKIAEYKMENVYNYIARKYNDTDVRVERAMRVSRTPANSKIQQEFHCNKSISNKAFLNIIKFLRFE